MRGGHLRRSKAAGSAGNDRASRSTRRSRRSSGSGYTRVGTRCSGTGPINGDAVVCRSISSPMGVVALPLTTMSWPVGPRCRARATAMPQSRSVGREENLAQAIAGQLARGPDVQFHELAEGDVGRVDVQHRQPGAEQRDERIPPPLASGPNTTIRGMCPPRPCPPAGAVYGGGTGPAPRRRAVHPSRRPPAWRLPRRGRPRAPGGPSPGVVLDLVEHRLDGHHRGAERRRLDPGPPAALLEHPRQAVPVHLDEQVPLRLGCSASTLGRDRRVAHMVAGDDDDRGGPPHRGAGEPGGAGAVRDHLANPRRRHRRQRNRVGIDDNDRVPPTPGRCLRLEQRTVRAFAPNTTTRGHVSTAS